MRAHEVDLTVDCHGVVWRVIGEYIPGRPGRYSGPPEDWYPDEDSEWDEVSVFPVDDGISGQDLSEFLSMMHWHDTKASVFEEILDQAELLYHRASDEEPPDDFDPEED